MSIAAIVGSKGGVNQPGVGQLRNSMHGPRLHSRGPATSRSQAARRNSLPYCLGMDYLLVAHDQTLTTLDLDPKKWTTCMTIWP